MNMEKNADCSVDIYCGPTAPAGFESNWIPTVAGKSWFAYFRIYQRNRRYNGLVAPTNFRRSIAMTCGSTNS